MQATETQATTLTTTGRIKAALSKGLKKQAIISASGISYNTFQKRFKDNSWEPAEIAALNKSGLI